VINALPGDRKPGRRRLADLLRSRCAAAVTVGASRRARKPGASSNVVTEQKALTQESSTAGGVEVKYFLVSLPVIGVLLGATVFNRVTPFVLGMPVFFAWTLFNVLMMSAIMLIIYKIDPVNAPSQEENR
jgi:hypothetical protein